MDTAKKLHYAQLSDETKNKIAADRDAHIPNPYAFKDENALRRDMTRDKSNIMRPPFQRDVDKIMNIPYYTRYTDKTQVFSLHKNDDISRRAYHVQLVSKIARNIGRLLNLNIDLIEAIALGHDIGHTPFGHAGERKLSEIYHRNTQKYFNHNIQSGRILDTIFPVNVTLQTLDGIICHNGELELKEYRPEPIPVASEENPAATDNNKPNDNSRFNESYVNQQFSAYEKKVETCLHEKNGVKTLIPTTLEGCVVRVSDIIAYIGKDRQDAVRLGYIADDHDFCDLGIGTQNAEIINNIMVNIVENSYGKPYLKMDDEYFEAFRRAKSENYEMIYSHDTSEIIFEEQIFPMFEDIYEKLLTDLVNGDESSVIYTHHIEYIKKYTSYYADEFPYMKKSSPDDIVVDYIASMTDDYFIELYKYLFPNGKYDVQYKGYFE